MRLLGMAFISHALHGLRHTVRHRPVITDFPSKVYSKAYSKADVYVLFICAGIVQVACVLIGSSRMCSKCVHRF